MILGGSTKNTIGQSSVGQILPGDVSHQFQLDVSHPSSVSNIDLFGYPRVQHNSANDDTAGMDVDNDRNMANIDGSNSSTSNFVTPRGTLAEAHFREDIKRLFVEIAASKDEVLKKVNEVNDRLDTVVQFIVKLPNVSFAGALELQRTPQRGSIYNFILQKLLGIRLIMIIFSFKWAKLTEVTLHFPRLKRHPLRKH